MFETRADVMAMFEQFRSVDKADLVSFIVGRRNKEEEEERQLLIFRGFLLEHVKEERNCGLN